MGSAPKAGDITWRSLARNGPDRALVVLGDEPTRADQVRLRCVCGRWWSQGSSGRDVGRTPPPAIRPPGVWAAQGRLRRGNQSEDPRRRWRVAQVSMHLWLRSVHLPGTAGATEMSLWHRIEHWFGWNGG